MAVATIHTKNLSINAAGTTTVPQGDGASPFGYNGEFIYRSIQTIKARGGTVTYSSTRTSGTGTDANGRSNTDTWDGPYRTAYGLSQIAWSMPAVRGVTRHYCAQIGPFGNTSTWRLKMNFTAAYTTSGGGSATQVPAVAGERVLFGGGTDASPTFVAFGPTSGSFYFQSLYYDTANLGGVVCAMYPTTGGTAGCAGAFFAIDPFQDGTYESGDDDAVTISLPKIPLGYELVEAYDYVRYVAQKGLGGAAITSLKGLSKGPIPGSAAASARSGRRPGAQISWTRDTAPTTPGGVSTCLIWNGPVTSVPNRAKLYSLKTGSFTEKLLLGEIGMDWDGTVPS